MPRNIRPTASSAFICGECQKRFPRRADCLRHVQTHDANAKRYECAWPGCVHSTLQKSNLKTHFLATHLRARLYGCTIEKCRDTFSDQSSLIRHEKRMHHYFRRHHPYGRHGVRKVVELDEDEYIKGAVPRTPAVTPEPPSASKRSTESPRTSASPVPSLMSGTSFPSSIEENKVEDPHEQVITLAEVENNPKSPRFTCDGGPRDPFVNPAVFEEFMARLPNLESLLQVDLKRARFTSLN